jgi:hypothetical protein
MMEDTEPCCGYPTKRAMLEDLYVKNQLSIAQIAKRISTGSATIERWLRLLEIPRRSRGGANNTAYLGWNIHRLDPRFVFGSGNRIVAEVIGASTSFVWKYKKGVTDIWSFV